MKNTKLSFVIDIIDSTPILDKIKYYFAQTYSIDDTIVFSKDPVLSQIPKEYGILSTFYFKFYAGLVVFFTLEDYLEAQADLIDKVPYLYVDNRTIPNIEMINRAMLKDINMIMLDVTGDQIVKLELNKTI